MQILTNQAVDGNSAELNTSNVKRGDGRYMFSAQGTWDGATVKLQYSLDGGTTFIDCGAYTTLTANGGGIATIPHGAIVRADQSGSGASTDINAYLETITSS